MYVLSMLRKIFIGKAIIPPSQLLSCPPAKPDDDQANEGVDTLPRHHISCSGTHGHCPHCNTLDVCTIESRTFPGRLVCLNCFHQYLPKGQPD